MLLRVKIIIIIISGTKMITKRNYKRESGAICQANHITNVHFIWRFLFNFNIVKNQQIFVLKQNNSADSYLMQ